MSCLLTALAVCGLPRGEDSAPSPYRNTAKDQGPCFISFLLQLQYVTLCIQKRLGASPGRQSAGPDICPRRWGDRGASSAAFPVALVWTACKGSFKCSSYFHLQAQVWAGMFLFLCAIRYLHCCYIARNFISSPQAGPWDRLPGLPEVFSFIPGLCACASAKALFPVCRHLQSHWRKVIKHKNE